MKNTRPRLAEAEVAAIIDALELRRKIAVELFNKCKNEMNWRRCFQLERTISFLDRLIGKLKNSLNRYGQGRWTTETPITDLVLLKEIETKT